MSDNMHAGLLENTLRYIYTHRHQPNLLSSPSFTGGTIEAVAMGFEVIVPVWENDRFKVTFEA